MKNTRASAALTAGRAMVATALLALIGACSGGGGDIQATFTTSTASPATTTDDAPTAAPSAATAQPSLAAAFTPSPESTTPAGTHATFGSGTWLVGTDIAPGTYRATADGDFLGSCYWARLKGTSGEMGDILANNNFSGTAVVTIKPTDKAFETTCDWSPAADDVPASPRTAFGEGTWLVGSDITPGTYRATAGTDVLDSCYWARLRGTSGDMGEIIANNNFNGSGVVTIRATDTAFETTCSWSRA